MIAASQPSDNAANDSGMMKRFRHFIRLVVSFDCSEPHAYHPAARAMSVNGSHRHWNQCWSSMPATKGTRMRKVGNRDTVYLMKSSRIKVA